MTFYLPKQVRWIWPLSCSLPTSALDHPHQHRNITKIFRTTKLLWSCISLQLPIFQLCFIAKLSLELLMFPVSTSSFPSQWTPPGFCPWMPPKVTPKKSLLLPAVTVSSPSSSYLDSEQHLTLLLFPSAESCRKSEACFSNNEASINAARHLNLVCCHLPKEALKPPSWKQLTPAHHSPFSNPALLFCTPLTPLAEIMGFLNWFPCLLSITPMHS